MLKPQRATISCLHRFDRTIEWDGLCHEPLYSCFEIVDVEIKDCLGSFETLALAIERDHQPRPGEVEECHIVVYKHEFDSDRVTIESD